MQCLSTFRTPAWQPEMMRKRFTRGSISLYLRCTVLHTKAAA